MAYTSASSNLLTAKFTAAEVANGRLPAPLGVPIYYKGGKFIFVKNAHASVAFVAGKSVAFKAGSNPSLFECEMADDASVATLGLSLGYALSAPAAGEYGCLQIAGPYTDVSPTIITDGNVVAGGFFIAGVPAAGADGTSGPGTAGTHDHLRMGNAVNDDSGTSLTQYILFDRFSL